ncbi:MAG: GNAT family N-acetyltransferase [Snodgrassella sp.]|uniref:GNAT family N-acetyltransferase n=1 Tax=Snodgrassella sp. TaxID=2815304 RepID=UPI00259085B9|nr:GNAT family N-acetyltransferase [Snodgrassella sp.]MCO6509116.1 GNAT family N-acetyltransferase [Snodgrassella sp.]
MAAWLVFKPAATWDVMNYLTQLEPDELVEIFLTNPPQDFTAWQLMSGVPAFAARFDLLTTADADFQQKIRHWPLFRWWQRFLQPLTCFIGTTVSEYALLTQQQSAQQLALEIKQNYGKKYPLLIVKDIPQQSPLLDTQANDYAATLIQSLQQQGFIAVEGQALAWVPIDFNDIDEYLSRLSYQRRKNFRRKLKTQSLIETGCLYSGDVCFQDEAVLDQYYQLYLNVYNQSEIHFDLLTREFFVQLLQDSSNQARIFTYHHQQQLIGYNICFVLNNMLVDKYIGFVYPQARELNLYYLSWFYNLDYARQHGLDFYVAGWTDPQVKASLGAQFTFTKHMVYVRNPVLRTLLAKISNRFEQDKTWQEANKQLKLDSKKHE